ncbi:MAG: hypothetical protein QM706_15920 [Nitrospira sp.]
MKTIALKCIEQAAKRAPLVPEFHHALATLHDETGDYNGVLARAMTAASLNPQDPRVMQTVGAALSRLGKTQVAEAWYTRSLCLDPHNKDVWFGYSTLALQRGDYETGFTTYEARRRSRHDERLLACAPLWDGKELDGKTGFQGEAPKILVWTEQGYGDAIQNIRYAPLVSRKGARVIVLCPPALERLFKTLDGVHVVTSLRQVGNINYQISVMCLPGRFKTTIETIPAAPYLSAPLLSDIRLDSGRKFASGGSLKAGLVWSGNVDTVHERSRAVRLEYLLPLIMGAGDIDWYSLQVGPPAHEIKRLGLSDVIHDLSPLLHDFADTASAISQLDLVVTVDTAVAHLAGALGKPVWIMLPYAADWRWMQNRADSPWYPTARLFRQPWPGNWIAPVMEVREALSRLVEDRLGAISSEARPSPEASPSVQALPCAL